MLTLTGVLSILRSCTLSLRPLIRLTIRCSRLSDITTGVLACWSAYMLCVCMHIAPCSQCLPAHLPMLTVFVCISPHAHSVCLHISTCSQCLPAHLPMLTVFVCISPYARSVCLHIAPCSQCLPAHLHMLTVFACISPHAHSVCLRTSPFSQCLPAHPPMLTVLGCAAFTCTLHRAHRQMLRLFKQIFACSVFFRDNEH